MSLIQSALRLAKEEGYAAMLKRSARYFSFSLFIVVPLEFLEAITTPPARRGFANAMISRMRRQASSSMNVGDMVNFAWSPLPPGILIRPIQVKGEMSGLLSLLASHPPKRILEIGTGNGGTLFLFAQVSASDATIISIDLPTGSFGGGYPKWKIPLYKSFARDSSQRIVLLREDSHKQETLDKVRNILGGYPLDFVFIDGDHTYQGVKEDFEMYLPLVREGGVIAFHDIVKQPPGARCKVSEFWSEIRNAYQHLEIVRDWNQEWAGIGVLYARRRSPWHEGGRRPGNPPTFVDL